MSIYDKYGIDVKKLSTDYINLGGLKREAVSGGGKRLVLPPKDDIAYLYNVKNVSIIDLGEIFNISRTKVFQVLKHFDLDKTGRRMRENLERSLKEKYGTENPFYAGKFNEDVRRIIRRLSELHFDITDENIMIKDDNVFIFVPQTKFVLSYHRTEKKRKKTYFQEMTINYSEQGKRILHIWDYEFKNDGDAALRKVDLIVPPTHKIYARNTVVRVIDITTKKVFLGDNHLQGNDNATVSYGLFHNEVLVAVMTFCKPRFNKNYEWEISRFCSLKTTRVIGGGSKLLKKFEDDYKPTNLISYTDWSLFDGEIYAKLGFVEVGHPIPSYNWINDTDVLPWYKTRKYRLLNKGFVGETETDIMTKMGYKKVYGCGNKLWVKSYV